MNIIYNKDLSWIKLYITPFYNSPYKYFHNINHINSGLKTLGDLILTNEQYIAWLFHDIVYFPGYDKNEDSSAQYMRDFCKSYNININVETAYKIIIDTKNHTPTIEESNLVLDMDMYTLGNPSYQQFKKDRKNVVLEYEKFCGGTSIAEKGVIDFLKNIQGEKIFHTDKYKNFQPCFEKNVDLYIKEFDKKTS